MLPALIGAGASLLGTFLGNQQREAGQNKEIELQKEFAQHGLRWKIEDAERAGVHPLAALGATGASYSPVGLGQNDTAAGFSAAGDSVARAVDATRTKSERAGYDATVQRLTLTRMGLENDLLASQIAQINQAGRGPPFPMSTDTGPFADQGDVGTTVPTPFGGPALRVRNPKLAQTAQDHFGEPLEWAYGLGNWLDSVATQAFEEGAKHVTEVQKKGADRRRMYDQ